MTRFDSSSFNAWLTLLLFKIFTGKRRRFLKPEHSWKFIARVGMNPESRLVDSEFKLPNLTASESCESRVQNFWPILKPSLIFLNSVRVRVCEIGLGECARQTMLRNDELKKVRMTHCRAVHKVILWYSYTRSILCVHTVELSSSCEFSVVPWLLNK